jgi:hypothetical protein
VPAVHAARVIARLQHEQLADPHNVIGQYAAVFVGWE